MLIHLSSCISICYRAGGQVISHLYLASGHGCATIETPLPADIRINRVNSMTQHYKGKRQSQARGFGDSHTLMCAMMPDGQVRTIESSRPDSELSAWIRQARQDGSVSIYCESLEHVGVDVPELSASDHLKAFNDLPWPDLVKCTQRTFPGCGCGGYHAAGSEVSE